jgi:hypothetical protein
MANEIEKTIEELEAEVVAELEEANGADAPKKSAVAAEKQDKLDKVDGDEIQDTGDSPSKPMDKTNPTAKAVAKAKEVSGDPAQKSEGKPQKMSKAKDAGQNKPLAKEGYSDEEIRELCHSKDHDCAVVVEHPEWGKGKPVHGSHAIPDDEGNVEWYDVQFKHGIEEKVMAEDMKIVVSEAHHEDMHEPKTKAEYLSAMKHMMDGMHKEKKDTLMAMYNGMKKSAEMAHGDKEEETKEKKEAIEKRVKSVDVKEHVDALINGEGDLSEEFKRKAATVFEAAVKSKIRDEVVRLEDEYQKELEESIDQTKSELTEKVDTYLNYVVEEWMKENELAIERGLKGEIAEDFISGLKTLFEDHYVDIPDEKYDVLEAQSEKITELEGKLNESVKRIVNLKKNNGTLVREQVIREATNDLAETEIEKFKSLTEDVDFTDEESFREKLGTLKENYFPKNQKEPTETIDDVETGTAQDVDTTDSMKAYMSAIGKFGNSAK